MERPIVLCGLGRVGTRVLEFLQAAQLPVIVIDTTCRANDPRLKGVRLVNGDCRSREVLESADVANARGVLILTSDDLLNISATLMVRAVNPSVRVVIRMFNENLIGRLGQAIQNVIALSTSLLTAPILAVTAITGQGLATFRMEGQTDGWRQVAEVVIGPASDLRGRTIAEVVTPREAVVVGHLRDGGLKCLLDVDLEERLKGGDRLVLCGPPRLLEPLLAEAGEGEPPHLRWAGWLRRMGRVAWQTLVEMDRAVLICTLILLSVVLVSTLILHLGVQKYRISDALFRTISVMATGASMHEEDFVESAGMKVFVSVLRIFGAALTAAFTAIVTNYLLRARLGGIFEVRRIPDSGHVLVCGLGAVGFRTIEELLRLGERVVVVERDSDNHFVSTTRRLGVPVIIGDAAVSEVLRQANARTARSVIAATSNDLTNLAVALQVREFNPKQRVVLLLSDPQLAEMLRVGANVRFAFSVSVLSAPTFLAGLYGDRVLCVFLVRERLCAVIDLVIQEQDPFVNQPVRAIAVDYKLHPIAVLPTQAPVPHYPLNARLSSGDRLVAVTALSDLESLLRRKPASAAWAVDVTTFPLPARDWLIGMVRTLAGLGQEEAEKAIEQLPLRLATNLTRGQAEDLLARLVRERVAGKLSTLDWSEPKVQSASPERANLISQALPVSEPPLC
jgi:Trk K+ transport system NAD-binding subunit